MCGICGIITKRSEGFEERLLEEMCRTIGHRGPDDDGIWVSEDSKFGKIGLGHKRLSIIDLSDAGHQPMFSKDGTLAIVYNGEIYNFKELRTELEKKGHTFQSQTDTEVILHLYEEEGLEAIQRLNGMFAFALWDEKNSRLWICRDRIGIKPLVYCWDGKHFVFASEIKALLCDPVISKNLNYEALYLYLSLNYIPAPYTIFDGIKKLEPGQYILLENGKLEIRKYWDIPQNTDPQVQQLPHREQHKIYEQQLFEILSDAVRIRMIADVPLGAFLSGGIDSSIIVALMAMHSKTPVKTFSIGFKDDKLYDETSYAREVAHLYKTDHHEFKLSYQELLDVFPEVLSTFDEPFADSSAIPTYIVSRETRKHVTVALSGDGGDELFAGYRSYLGEFFYPYYLMIPSIIRKGGFEKIINRFPDSRNVKILEYIRRLKKFIKGSQGNLPERLLSLREVFPLDLRQDILIKNWNRMDRKRDDLALEWIKKKIDSFQGDPINTILFTDVKNSLPGDMLTKVDWMSMKNSLEVRVPLLDHRVVEFAFNMPGPIKLRGGITKYILKETFQNILPKSLYRRPKAGFEIPISRWLKTDLRFLIDKYLGRERIVRQGIFDYPVIEKLIGYHMANKTDTSWMLWNLIVFQHWYESYL